MLSITLLLAALAWIPGGDEEVPTKRSADASGGTSAETPSRAVAWLEGEARRLIRAAKRDMEDGTAAFPPQVGIGYAAFWLRDYAYTLEGSIDAYSEAELEAACRLFVRSLREDGAGVDCVKYDGTPIYKPGYGGMGEHPVADGSQFTVAVAWHTIRRTKDRALHAEVIDHLVRTMKAVPRNPKTGLVRIDPDRPWDRCPYGFTDTARKTGDVLFCSLLFTEACKRLADLLARGGRGEEGAWWAREGERTARSIRETFWDDEKGLFRAATVKCREHDIWGSAFAVYLGVADERRSDRVARYFKQHYGEIVRHGQVRHLPGGVYWERGCARDTYQNGAYWATPAGWFAFTIDRVDPALADRTILELVAHIRKHGACEWIYGDTRKLPGYLASASLPLAGFRAVLARRAAEGGDEGSRKESEPARSDHEREE